MGSEVTTNGGGLDMGESSLAGALVLAVVVDGEVGREIGDSLEEGWEQANVHV